jgi:tetratricopeptide (TPR) repeat protein
VMYTQLGAAELSSTTIAEAEAAARDLGQPDLLARILVSRSTTMGVLGQWPDSERVGREAELTARAAGLEALAAQALTAVGTARREQGDLAGARAAHTEELAVGEWLGDDLVIATAQTNLGNVAIGEQRFEEMYERYAIAERLLVALDLPASLLPLLANRGQVNQAMDRPHDAAADFEGAATAASRSGHHQAVKQWGDVAVQLSYQLGDVVRAERVWALLEVAGRSSGDDASLQLALGEHALLLINRAQATTPSERPVDAPLLVAALELLDEQEMICRSIGNDVGLASCVGNRAIVLRYQGDLEGSLACLDEQLDVATRSNNAQGALFAAANRGEVLGLLGRVPEALAGLDGARRTAAQYGLTPMVQQLDQMIAALRDRR